MASLSESLAAEACRRVLVTAKRLAELETEVASLRVKNASFKGRIRRARQTLEDLWRPVKIDRPEGSAA